MIDAATAAEELSPAPSPQEDASGLLPTSIGFPIRLNERWRVSFDQLQWILERYRGGRWIGSAYCVTRETLLRNIRERAGTVDANALALVAALPEWHPDRTRGEP